MKIELKKTHAAEKELTLEKVSDLVWTFNSQLKPMFKTPCHLSDI
jgi:hypothetical protein